MRIVDGEKLNFYVKLSVWNRIKHIPDDGDDDKEFDILILVIKC